MNEQDWFTWWDAFDLLSWCEDDECKLDQRKLRLFAVACCRTIWPLLTDKLSRRAVEVAEWAADEEHNQEALQAVRRDAEEALRIAEPEALGPAPTKESVLASSFAELAQRLTLEDFAHKYMAQDVADVVNGLAMRAPIPSRLWGTADGDAIAEKAGGERGEVECGLVRELFCNPLRPLSVDPSWLLWNGGSVTAMAERVYHNREYELMPILADALEEAGCTEASILEHCRGSGVHVRGCWVLDLLLDKKGRTTSLR
jgi:hypothetical protein